MNESSLGY
jgi:hypothetical protein